MIEVTFLGTGPVGGVEAPGRSGRRESSAMVRYEGENILIDTTSDFDEQIRGCEKVNAVLLTHGHSDAIGGMARLGKWWKARYWDKVPVYGLGETIRVVKKRFKRLEFARFVKIVPGEVFPLLDLVIKPFLVRHSIQAGFPTVGFAFIHRRKCELVYVSDVGEWGEGAKRLMEKAEVLVIDGAMWKKKIVPHQAVKLILPIISKWKNKRIIFTQVGKSVPSYEAANAEIRRLCPKARLAYDGMKLLIK